MNEAHYILFHPDKQREQVEVKATIIENNNIISSWVGKIFVDKIYIGNEDPFVFTDPWIYSYCHASQLRRQIRDGVYLQHDSVILFCSGNDAERGFLTCDTVFVIGGIESWTRPPLALPEKYQNHFQNKKSQLWQRHFRPPFETKSHEGVTHSYEAKQWNDVNHENYSFLPLTDLRKRVSIKFSQMPDSISNKIKQNVKGKVPLLLSEAEIRTILRLIKKQTHTKVIRDIKLLPIRRIGQIINDGCR